jgi:hypothetical protein
MARSGHPALRSRAGWRLAAPTPACINISGDAQAAIHGGG